MRLRLRPPQSRRELSLRSGVFFSALASLALAAAESLAAAAALDAPRMSVKRLFAPASDVESGLLQLPPPEATPTRSHSLVLVDAFASASERTGFVRFRFEHAGGTLRLMPLGRDACLWRGRILIGDTAIPLSGSEALVARVTEQYASQLAFGLDDSTRVCELDVPAGDCVVEFFAEVPAGTRAMLAVDDGGDREETTALVAHLASRVHRAGAELEIVVRGESRLAHGVVPAVTHDVEVTGATVTWSDGVVAHPRRVRAMRDGSVRVEFAAARRGNAVVRVDGIVRDREGNRRQRSLFYLARISDGATIAGAAVVHADDVASDWIHCDFAVASAEPGESVFVCAELCAVAGAEIRVLGWIGGLASIESCAHENAPFVRLGFDRRQIELRAGERLVFRNVRLHERDGFAPLDTRAEVAPEMRVALPKHAPAAPLGSLDWAGLSGIASVALPEISLFVPPVGGHALVLSHGYCAGSNPWPLSHFASDAWPYENLGQNLSNDMFAVDLATRAAQFKSYGIVGHSQGGNAALHLYTFYWSGLDWAGPGRLMQCVGSPLEGTPLAGNLAAFGAALGIQCGSNYDITPDGAAVWLSGIPTSARAKLHTHTTTFTNVPFVYDYCSIATDFFLSDPEDGVVEHSSGHIVGAQDMGLKTGWCHVGGMRDPAQTGDAIRNATMNAQGAR
jgi:hypothetical protein